MIPAFRYWLENMGDHTVASWVCAAVQLMAGVGSWRKAARSMARSPERTLWVGVAVLLLAIGLNKQLDLHILAVKELEALFGRLPFWGSRRLIAGVLLTALGVIVVGTSVTVARTVDARVWPHGAVVGAATALTCLVLARGTTGAVNDVLVMDLHGSVGDIWQVQLKDVLELSTAFVIVVSCLVWRSVATGEADTRRPQEFT